MCVSVKRLLRGRGVCKIRGARTSSGAVNFSSGPNRFHFGLNRLWFFRTSSVRPEGFIARHTARISFIYLFCKSSDRME
ncbi:hypothetical protein HanRHA438_Chr05g0239121 [Helianthus annuus]|uniref:Uncharacterized protein n=1 Tax=Helianthus annuus TaxID=4232 RepID=A0A251TK67_HELAN|nr:hypothetical protein HanXRQr2_Chr05g0230011 [Helianthus annuus]KAJ0920237.1 hypothetical protein HanRHA438_Chr05g0239121 [Helianthus annuus]KAJ0923885.1 hypothetical protein HanPSC8_Chr05g0221861 [Helianthus annuus]